MFSSLALLVLAGLLGPLLAAGRKPVAPVLVGELIAGVILGHSGLGLIDAGAQPFPAFFSIGFAMLMFSAGMEVDLGSPDLRHAVLRGGAALLLTAALAVPVGLAISTVAGVPRPLLILVLLAGSSAAVAFPAISEFGLSGPAVSLLMAWITLADASTALLMPLTLVGASKVPLALLGDVAIVVIAVALVVAGHMVLRGPLADEARRESHHRGWALQLRASVLVMLVLAAVADRTGASLLVAGFAAGIVVRQFRQPHRLEQQVTGLANGFFVPAFFVLVGTTLDLRGLVTSPSAIGLALAMAAASTAVHVAAAFAAARDQKLSSGLAASVQLGLPAAAAALARGTGLLSPAYAAALVAGGGLTLIPATIGTRRMAAQAPPVTSRAGSGTESPR